MLGISIGGLNNVKFISAEELDEEEEEEEAEEEEEDEVAEGEEGDTYPQIV